MTQYFPKTLRTHYRGCGTWTFYRFTNNDAAVGNIEALKTTPAKALGVVDRAWSIGNLIDAALATQPITPVPTAPERRKRFTVIDGGRK